MTHTFIKNISNKNTFKHISNHCYFTVISNPNVGTPPPDDTWRASLSGATPSGLPKEGHVARPLSGLPQGEAHDTRKHHIRTIAYPIRIYCPDR